MNEIERLSLPPEPSVKRPLALSVSQMAALSRLLEQALPLDRAARSRWLEALAPEYRDLADILREALMPEQIEDPASDKLATLPKFRANDEGTPGGEGGLNPGERLGPYELIRPLGAGGMAEVWLAGRADGAFTRDVALKLPLLLRSRRDLALRFAREREILASLTHPNIARLYDAGVTQHGQPYLALEYVVGMPLTTYCDNRRLTLRERLALFGQVLGAVQYAHANLVIHRDLKPSNILVTGDGQVQLLDFGIAKLLSDGEAKETELTRLGGRALTPDYAAPEQIAGAPITTAADVYALGVILYEILTGERPYRLKRDSRVMLEEAILHADATTPSHTSLSEHAAQLRATSPKKLARALKGELDTIVMKALKKSPDERYATANAFGEDIGRFLSGDVVLAQPDTIAYRAIKFVGRHKVVVAAASITLLALVAGVVSTTLQAREARRQRSEAVTQRDRAQTLLARNEAIFDFVDMMLTESVPPDQTDGIQQMLDRGVKFVDIASAGRPDRQAQMLRMLASYQSDLNNPQKAAPLLERARQLVEHTGDPSLQAQLDCSYADSLKLLGHGEEAVKILDQWGANMQIDGNVAAACLQTRAILAQNDANATDALRFAEMALQRERSAPIPSARLEAALFGDKGFALHLQGRNAEADQYYAEALRRFRQLGLEGYGDARRITADWGIVAYGSGDFKRGLALYEHAVSISERMSGNAPVDPAMLGNYAFGLEALGRYDEALKEYDRTFQSATQTGYVGAQAYALIGKAGVLVQLKDLTHAQSNLDRAAQLMKGTVPEGHPAQMRRMMIQALIDAARGRAANANQAVSHVIELLSARGSSHAAMANAYRQRAELESGQGEGKLAEADARKALQVAQDLQGGKPFSGDTGLAYLTLGSILLQSGDVRGSHAALQAAVDHLSNSVGAEHPDTLRARGLLTQQ